jgi:molybdopterin converting factor subunit 1
MTKVTVLYFGQSREISGVSEEEFSIPEGSSLPVLIGAVGERHAKIRRFAESMQVAVNEEIAEGNERLKEGDTVALLPPVAGG